MATSLAPLTGWRLFWHKERRYAAIACGHFVRIYQLVAQGAPIPDQCYAYSASIEDPALIDALEHHIPVIHAWKATVHGRYLNPALRVWRAMYQERCVAYVEAMDAVDAQSAASNLMEYDALEEWRDEV